MKKAEGGNFSLVPTLLPGNAIPRRSASSTPFLKIHHINFPLFPRSCLGFPRSHAPAWERNSPTPRTVSRTHVTRSQAPPGNALPRRSASPTPFLKIHHINFPLFPRSCLGTQFPDAPHRISHSRHSFPGSAWERTSPTPNYSSHFVPLGIPAVKSAAIQYSGPFMALGRFAVLAPAFMPGRASRQIVLCQSRSRDSCTGPSPIRGLITSLDAQ